MKTLEMAFAPAQLKDYARAARRETLLITLKGKPYVMLTAAGPRTDLENLTVTTHPKFQAIIERSERRRREEGGLTSDEVREQLRSTRRSAKTQGALKDREWQSWQSARPCGRPGTGLA